MSFATVKANLLYIQENDLSEEIQQKLNSLNNPTVPLYVVVRLKMVSNGFEPMINNLKEIRIEKAKKKIKDWTAAFIDEEQPLDIKIDDEKSSIIRVDIDFKAIQQLTVFCAQKDAKAVRRFIKKQFSKKDFQINHI